MKRFFLVLSVLFFIQISSVHASDIMPLSDIKEGMIGVGRTVFKGNKIEEFHVEILGVLKNYLPQQDLIIGMLKGGNLEETGVIAGMSGSPVFINGKMIGAVAYSWPFAKTPIAGITPIERMLETEVMPTEQPPIAPPIELSQYYNFEKVMTRRFGGVPPVQTSVSGFGPIQLTPIALPMSISGFDQRVVNRFTSLFSAFGLQPMQTGGSLGTDATSTDTNLEPGSPVSVQLIKGDFDIGAIGTVTYRNENKILAFGHPFFNLGPINFPMATAKIFTVVPSLQSSFKVGSAGPTVGAIKQDLHSAVFGVMGQKSPMIPVTLNLLNDNKTKRTFHFEVANHKLLSPLLIDFAFQNSILVTQLGYSESTLKISGLIDMKDSMPVQINNIFSGAGSFTNASQYVASILYLLMTNDFKNVDIEGITINVDTTMKRKEAELVEVWLDRNEAHPGEQVKMKAVYRPLLGENKIEDFTLQIPSDITSDEINFVVGGGTDITKQEYRLYRKAYEPQTLEQIISTLNNIRPDDRIYVKAFLDEESLIMKGQPLSSLPSSVFSVLSSSQTIGSSQKVDTLTLWEDSHPIGYYVTGTKMFSLKILPKQN